MTILSTVGNKINIVGENKSQFFYKERLDFTTNYYYRHYDQEEAIPYNEIKEKIDNEKGILLTIYHILLDLEGDIVIDLYCEVDKL
ncbi:succinyl-CoA ligase (ADP-forming) subunit beta [Listeria ivanovii FSL F6-596]|nr:succinyl-CoA ligase (ADP-forming) subunit beta [Listeria ivanovii FSL F6-596]